MKILGTLNAKSVILEENNRRFYIETKLYDIALRHIQITDDKKLWAVYSAKAIYNKKDNYSVETPVLVH